MWPLVIISLNIYYNELGAEPVKKIMNHFGEWTLIFICLTLAMSPLKRFTNLAFWTKFRRMLGLFVFFYATIHLLTYIGLDYRFDWQPIFNDVLKKKFIFIGFSAWLLLIPLAATSSQKMINLTHLDVLSAFTSNVLAVTISTIPNYLLNRLWVWKRVRNHSFRNEILPYWVIAFLGLALCISSAACLLVFIPMRARDWCVCVMASV